MTLRITAFILSLTFVFYSSYSQAEETYSKANQLLFFSNHLAQTPAASKLTYQFTKAGSAEVGFSDTIVLQVSAGKTGKNVHVDYFTQDRRQFFPDMEEVTGNPMLLIFLQRSVQELQRLAPIGHWRYFQNQVKTALEEKATIQAIQFTYQDKMVNGQEITIYPFKDDSKFDAYPVYQQTRYQFILSTDIKGELYQLSWQTPATNEPPLLSETLTLTAE
ncbi:hypothetical protein BegalDRAFT_0063 [Beggiatoa alba B18LD]|uniref:Uncharacterized protein n=1 Tax=Beggiatoa alba B18LD TaxID=395493 RepID=I3CBJ6_9GAMM|nr:hypothetical protein [Beggiatoa alba]EIJ40989.1 hypothetical protein BegalDRAFT_0063 [Beggiatoa alba B18LD]